MAARLKPVLRHGPDPHQHRSSTRTRKGSWAAILIGLTALTPALVQGHGKQAWTHARVSPGLHSLNQAGTVIYQPAPHTVPPGSIITAVYADRDYAGQADVQTSLCWNGVDRCIDVPRRFVNTRAFNGLDASRPMYLVHHVRGWRGGRPPLYIKGNVSVWYGPSNPLTSSAR